MLLFFHKRLAGSRRADYPAQLRCALRSARPARRLLPARHLWQLPRLVSGTRSASSSARKQQALGAYLDAHRWFKKEAAGRPCGLSIELGFADVYDITVATKHSYVANGFLNHDSFWHARIMRELELTDDDSIEYSVLNAGVVSPSRHSINPSYLGVKMLEHIERR